MCKTISEFSASNFPPLKEKGSGARRGVLARGRHGGLLEVGVPVPAARRLPQPADVSDDVEASHMACSHTASLYQGWSVKEELQFLKRVRAELTCSNVSCGNIALERFRIIKSFPFADFHHGLSAVDWEPDEEHRGYRLRQQPSAGPRAGVSSLTSSKGVPASAVRQKDTAFVF